MPRFLQPGQTFDVWLASDADVDAENRPTFEMQLLNGREIDDFFDAAQAIDAAETGRDKFEEGRKALAMVCVGWRNMSGLPFNEDNLRNLAPDEVMELLTLASNGQAPGAEALGNSESQLSSDSEDSATEVATANASQ